MKRAIGRWVFDVPPEMDSDPCFDPASGDWPKRLNMAADLVGQGKLRQLGPWYKCSSCSKKFLEWDDSPNGCVQETVTTGKKKLKFMGHICTSCELEYDKAKRDGWLRAKETMRNGTSKAT